jgi:hypothetical protein
MVLVVATRADVELVMESRKRWINEDRPVRRAYTREHANKLVQN